MSGPQVAWLEGGRRLHLNHGPIDLIIMASGAPGEVERAYAQAIARFDGLLEELVGELDALRRPVGERPRRFAGPVAQRMEAAAQPHHPLFVTPMAAVAGSVAEEILAAMREGTALPRAYVNNGGDIAFHLAPEETLRVAIGMPERGFGDRIAISGREAIRGIATSGRGGRSHSLGIADAVTVLAASAGVADVAATLIANAVDLPGHPAVARAPARSLSPDSDLGDLPVTTDLGRLEEAEIAQALVAGRIFAESLHAKGLIVAAALFLGDRHMVAGGLDPSDTRMQNRISLSGPMR